LGWRQVEVGRRLAHAMARADLGTIPVYYQNEADLAAIGEAEFGTRPADDPLVYISCGIGVGSGIVLNESLFTGATGWAGEIGHTTLVIDGAPCSCGRRGCAEADVGLKAIAVAAGQSCAEGVDRMALRTQMASRNKTSRNAFAKAGSMLGGLLHNTWTTFNPQAMVLGGETVVIGGEVFLQAAQFVLDSYAACTGLPPPELRVSRYAELATAVGAAAYVLHSLLHPLSRAPLLPKITGEAIAA
jgi:predicted NBD/HSP70 family sugar kinase